MAEREGDEHMDLEREGEDEHPKEKEVVENHREEVRYCLALHLLIYAVPVLSDTLEICYVCRSSKDTSPESAER